MDYQESDAKNKIDECPMEQFTTSKKFPIET